VLIEFFISGKNDPRSLTLNWDLNDRAVFGREITSPFRLEGPEISREHFALAARDNLIYIEDLSSNGTFLNGGRVFKGQWQRVSLGDVIEVPGYQIQVGLNPPEPAAGNTLMESIPSFNAWEIFLMLVSLGAIALVILYFQW
jgi:pSer/pThr/pTyr-binding forkhead associated (FHA) protein